MVTVKNTRQTMREYNIIHRGYIAGKPQPYNHHRSSEYATLTDKVEPPSVAGVECGGVRPYSGPPWPNFSAQAGGRTPHDGDLDPDWPRCYSGRCWGSSGVQRSRPPLGRHCGTSRGPFPGFLFWPLQRAPLQPGGSSPWRERRPQQQCVWGRVQMEMESFLTMVV